MADPMFATSRPANSLGLNINDVIEVIGDDLAGDGGDGGLLYGGREGNSAPSDAEYSTMSTATTTVDPMLHVKQKAYVRIIEQPQPKALRFRYICEGRSAGSIPGVRSTAENKTYPAIQVVGYTGPAVVVVSCVTVDPPYRPHPHNLVGKEGCKKGVCTMTINNESMQCVFSNLGIQCVKKRDVEEALRLREEIRVDPFQTGFSHRTQPQSIDLNALRLCFQVFLEGQTKGKFTFPLKPVVSGSVFDKKATCDLLICKLSDCTSSVAGGKEVILLCDKVTKEDIQVRFYEVTDGQITWEAFGDFQPSDVHKQVAIAFKTPRYKTLEIENPVKVYLQLQRPSDKETSEPRPFDYLPLDSGRPFMSFKRLKQSYGPFSRILGLDSNFMGLDETENDEDLKRKLPSVSLDTSLGVGLATSGGGIVKPARPAAAAASDDVKQRMSAALKRRNPAAAAATTPATGYSQTNNNMLMAPKIGANTTNNQMLLNNNKLSPIWSDLSSNCYSDAELLEDVLSEGSVNDLLSGVGGDGCTVYQDLDSSTTAAVNATTASNNPGLNSAITNTLSLLNSPGQLDALLCGVTDGGEFSGLPSLTSADACSGIEGVTGGAVLPPDALYGDASYASCYTNLEFVMNRAKQQRAAPVTGGDSLIRGGLFPGVPARVSNATVAGDSDNVDDGIYGVPSNRPVHQTKAALLQYRGFTTGTSQHQQLQTYHPADPNRNIIAEMDLGQDDDLLPKTVLDLFV